MTNPAEMAAMLRQMIAVLEAERHALAGLDLDALMASAAQKQSLCETFEAANDDDAPASALDEECRALTLQARRLNEINRQVRNLLARNVAARLDVLTGAAPTYSAKVRSQLAAGAL